MFHYECAGLGFMLFVDTARISGCHNRVDALDGLTRVGVVTVHEEKFKKILQMGLIQLMSVAY